MRIVNNGSSSITINSLTVDVAGCTFNLWPSNITVPFGGQAIFAQTVVASAGCGLPSGDDFDTSDIGPTGTAGYAGCTNDGVIPTVTATVDGIPTSLNDTGQVLNTGGTDRASCPSGPNESTQWSLIGGPSCGPATLTLSPDSQNAEVTDQATVDGTLVNGCGQPLSGVTVDFAVLSGGPNAGLTGSGTTNSSGVATFTYSSSLLGTDTIQGSVTNIAGTFNSTGNSTVTWSQEDTALSSTTSTQFIAEGGSASLSATLTDPDEGTVIANEPVTITLGSGAGSQSCTGSTDASGVATCTIGPVTVPLGPQPITDSFAGDTNFMSATNKQTALVFAGIAHGSFVIGDQNAAMGSSVTFWGAQWWMQNSLSGGTAPAAFKGFENSLAMPSCGQTWTTNPGNSSGPPATVPAYMSVVVSSSVSQSGSVITGNVQEVVIVKTNSGYAADPGHPGTGEVVAVVCSTPSP